MTVLTTDTNISYAGVPPQDTFAYNFRVDKKTDMFVSLDGVDIGQGAFTMTGLGDSGGGLVILNVPLSLAATVILLRQVTATQEVDYQPFDAFPAETHEGALDKLTMLVQQNTQGLTRALQFPLGDSAYPVLPKKTDRADKILTFDSNGNILLASVTGGSTVIRDDLAGVGDITSALSANQGFILNTTKEPTLGDPTTDGYVLSSTSAGARSWIPFAIPPSVEVLPALDLTINNNSVLGVFIYNTVHDDDHGAWVDKATTQSWYHEELNTIDRGATRAFPKLALIVAEGATVTVYDGDDPALPMWMVFNGGSSNMLRIFTGKPSVVAKNGIIYVASINSRLSILNMTDDSGTVIGVDNLYNGYLGNVSQRNDALSYKGSGDGNIINNVCNDIAVISSSMKNTVAVATDNGVSVIHPDFRVFDIVEATGADSIAIHDDVLGFSHGTNFNVRSYGPFPIFADFARTSWRTFYFQRVDSPTIPSPLSVKNLTPVAQGCTEFIGSEDGLTSHVAGEVISSSQSTGMVFYTTTDYVSGFMQGDIKGAWLASGDDTDLVGGELVVNGTFDVGTSDWTAVDCTLAVVANELEITNTASNGYAYQSLTTVIGLRYLVHYNNTNITGSVSVELNENSPTGSSLGSSSANDDTFLALDATSTVSVIKLVCFGDAGAVMNYDNITVSAQDPTRSSHINDVAVHLAVHGTITKSPVAFNAELMAYSGFNVLGSYLSQTGNTGLDFGSGDFYMMGWIDANSSNTTYWLSKFTGVNGFYATKQSSTALLRFRIGGTFYVSTTKIPDDVWAFVSVIRRDGIIVLVVNGNEEILAADSGSLSNTAPLIIGAAWDGSVGNTHREALIRIGAGALTTDQIKAIYEAEKPLFNQNAKCLLQGTSSDIRAMDFDPSNNILTVCSANHITKFNNLIVTEDRAEVIDSVSTVCNLELTGL